MAASQYGDMRKCQRIFAVECQIWTQRSNSSSPRLGNKSQWFQRKSLRFSIRVEHATIGGLLRTRNSETHSMRACVQRVSQAEVSVAGEVTGKIDGGLLVLLGVAVGDTDD